MSRNDIMRRQSKRPGVRIRDAGFALLAAVLSAPAVGVAATDSWLFIPASTFVSRETDVTFDYTGAGCIRRTAGHRFFMHRVMLPSDSEIKYVRTFSERSPKARLFTELYHYDGLGHYVFLSSSYTSQGHGHGSDQSQYLGHQVDTTKAYALVVNLDPSVDSLFYDGFDNSVPAEAAFCGVRINYIHPD